MFKASTLASACFALFFSVAAFGQTTHISKTRFTSSDGAFTIDLPSQANRNVLPLGSSSSGAGAGSYTWKIAEGSVTLSFVEGIRAYNDGFAVLNDFADSITSFQSKAGAKVAERIEFSENGNPGLQVRTEHPNGTAINRFIIVHNRLYILTANFRRPTDDSVIILILDSFHATDRGLLIA